MAVYADPSPSTPAAPGGVSAAAANLSLSECRQLASPSLSLQVVRGGAAMTVHLPAPARVLGHQALDQSYARLLCIDGTKLTNVDVRDAFTPMLPEAYMADTLDPACEGINRGGGSGCPKFNRNAFEYATLLFSSRPIHNWAAAGTCYGMASGWKAETERTPIAPASFCDTYLSSGEAISAATACGATPVQQRYGEVGYLSYLLYEYQATNVATAVPALSVPPLTEMWCVLVDGVEVPRPTQLATGELAILGIDQAGGYHTVEMYSRTLFGVAPQPVTVRRSIGGVSEQLGSAQSPGMCSGLLSIF